MLSSAFNAFWLAEEIQLASQVHNMVGFLSTFLPVDEYGITLCSVFLGKVGRTYRHEGGFCLLIFSNSLASRQEDTTSKFVLLFLEQNPAIQNLLSMGLQANRIKMKKYLPLLCYLYCIPNNSSPLMSHSIWNQKLCNCKKKDKK